MFCRTLYLELDMRMYVLDSIRLSNEIMHSLHWHRVSYRTRYVLVQCNTNRCHHLYILSLSYAYTRNIEQHCWKDIFFFNYIFRNDTTAINSKR